MSYYDENGERQYKSIRGAGGFPDSWAEFTGYINRLCGADYLCAEGEIVKVTPQYLSDVFKITEENIPYEILTAMVNSGQLGLKEITEHTFRMEVEANLYYKESLASVLEPFRQKTIETRDCTPEEYDLFVESFLGQIGSEWEEVERDQDKLRRFYHSEARAYFYIGKSMDLPDMENRDSGAARGGRILRSASRCTYGRYEPHFRLFLQCGSKIYFCGFL